MKSLCLKLVAVLFGLSFLPSGALAGPLPILHPQFEVTPLRDGASGLVWQSNCRNGGRDDNYRPPSDSGDDEDTGGEGGGGDDEGFALLDQGARVILAGFSGDCEDFGPNTLGLRDDTTAKIVQVLAEANVTCGRGVAGVYRIDCLSTYYKRIARQLPNTGDYAPIKAALNKAANDLDRIVQQNLDTSAPRVSPSQGGKPDAKRVKPLRAVRSDRLEVATQQAEAVVKEAELLILRSGGDPERRTPHYTAVAAAVEDNLLILRSA
ncbi:hypothetical protein Q9295_09145 [Xinfangfangia sp. CPCC 101601]|uniref:Uncharacterized protein n=1 Tax=Pseudogemmobacter lacusdianii TaxID=3069608 RepID=A0ABU0VXU9_9RHOB|nr:hypothetical protein [Xinfangfangia sp. CPCC 101601]MDQ2066539.1 hypothetical protein [Xinfangfangia sp. CPCC 101601]